MSKIDLSYQVYELHGGAPPRRGYHFDRNETLEKLDSKTLYSTICDILIKKFNPNNTKIVSVSLKSKDGQDIIDLKDIKTESDFKNLKNISDVQDVKNLTVCQILALEYVVIVYNGWQKGAVDIGEFVDSCPLNTDYKPNYDNTDKDINFEIHDLNNVAGFKVEMLDQFKTMVDDLSTNNNSDHDIKMNIKHDTLVNVFGNDILNELKSKFNSNIDEIIIRRCNVRNMHIPFHTDFAFKTLQISLNNDDEYEGGKLIFMTINKGKLVEVIPKRKAGNFTIHDNTIYHSVSTLKSGIRYGLFFLTKN